MPKRKNRKKSILPSTRSYFSKSHKLAKKKIRKIPSAQTFLLLGIIFLLLWAAVNFHLKRLSFDESIADTHIIASREIPTQLKIDSLNISLPIKQTTINDGVWQISTEGLSHLAASGFPDEESNIIIYGHNSLDRLANLYQIKKNDTIVITTQTGKEFTYAVSEIKVVLPSDIDSLTSYKGETLTIYTCTGLFDSQRLLVKAKRSNT